MDQWRPKIATKAQTEWAGVQVGTLQKKTPKEPIRKVGISHSVTQDAKLKALSDPEHQAKIQRGN